MKKILVLIGIIVILVAVGITLVIFNTQNKEKTMMSADKFNTVMENKGYEVIDSTSLFNIYVDFMSKSYLARKSDCQIEFYELTSIENAIDMYNTNKEKFESENTDKNPSIIKDGENYSTYSVTSNGKYRYVARVNNTVLYIDVYENYKDDVKEVIKEIGY